MKTITELIEQLEAYRDEFGGNTSVRLMTQSNWPLEYSIDGLCSGLEINQGSDDEDAEDPDDSDQDVTEDAVIYIVEGVQLGYGSKRAWDVCN